MKGFWGLIIGLVVSGGAMAQAPGATASEVRSDRCPECDMIVSDPHDAAQIVTAGQVLFFDDVGCLARYVSEGKIDQTAIEAEFVRSSTTEEWLPLDKAFWVLFKDLPTPMGYGFHAFPTELAADKFVNDHAGSMLVSEKDVRGADTSGR